MITEANLAFNFGVHILKGLPNIIAAVTGLPSETKQEAQIRAGELVDRIHELNPGRTVLEMTRDEMRQWLGTVLRMLADQVNPPKEENSRNSS